MPTLHLSAERRCTDQRIENPRVGGSIPLPAGMYIGRQAKNH